jgi:hypothetical protein
MHKPFRGPSSGRFVYLLVPLAALVFAACTSRGTLTIPAQGTQATMQSPTGCVETMCDFFYGLCADPCEACWDSCGREDDQVSVIKCTLQCNQICAPTAMTTPRDQCAAELSACRTTKRNTICVDRMRDDMPRGMPVCSPEINAANCACGADNECLGALDLLNEKCHKCNQQWVITCMEVACKAETDANDACMHAKGCSSVTSCGDCQAASSALLTCVTNAQKDPRDIGGCYSGPRICSGEPLCTFVPF